MSKIIEMAKKVKEASKKSTLHTEDQRNQAIRNIADALIQEKEAIIKANSLDLEAARENELSSAMIDRLALSGDRIESLAKSVREIADQPQVVGKVISEHTRDDGLQIQRRRIPLGVIGIIFESRPGVVVDCSALAIKSGNGVLLKGGKEAFHSNEILGSLVKKAVTQIINEDLIQVMDSRNREDIDTLLSLKDQVDVVIPRGGEGLINHVYKNAQMPVIAHFKGLCHSYIDKSADLTQALDIVVNAKASRPGVCNAMETLLIHQDVPENFIKDLLDKFKGAEVEVRGDSKICAMSSAVKPASEKDWETEYLDRILSIKIVASIDEAIAHISRYGSSHTETIIAKDNLAIELFLNSIEASCITINASSRFNDGGQLGLGAELGISTTKLHAFGPMGAEEMTTTHFVVTGDGHIRI